MKHSLVWMMTALTLMASNALAYNNPHILEVDLSIEGVDDPYEVSPGGFVAKDGLKKITLHYTGVNLPTKTRLNWDSDKIEVDGRPDGTDEIYWDPASTMPTQLWVRGLTASDTGPDGTNGGPEHLCLEAINNGTPYLYDRIAFTVYEVTNIIVIPKGMTMNDTLPDPVTIGAGAMDSEAHQADVEIQVTPAVAGIPVDVSLIDGLGHDEGKEAKLVMGTATATGGCAAVTVNTDSDGKIRGVLTSSDVLESCRIHAGDLEKEVRFAWDEVSESDEWSTDPGYLPAAGGTMNLTLTLRHHRDDSNSVPFVGHAVRMFVEEVEYVDASDQIQTLSYTPNPYNQADLDQWASCPADAVLTGPDGKVTIPLTIGTNFGLTSVSVAAYDYSIWNVGATGFTASVSASGGNASSLASGSVSEANAAASPAVPPRESVASLKSREDNILMPNVLLDNPEELPTGTNQLHLFVPVDPLSTTNLLVTITPLDGAPDDGLALVTNSAKIMTVPPKYISDYVCSDHNKAISFKLNATKAGKCSVKVEYGNQRQPKHNIFPCLVIEGRLEFVGNGPVKSPVTERWVLPRYVPLNGTTQLVALTASATLLQPPSFTTPDYKTRIGILGGAAGVKITAGESQFVMTTNTPGSQLNSPPAIGVRAVDMKASSENEGKLKRDTKDGRFWIKAKWPINVVACNTNHPVHSLVISTLSQRTEYLTANLQPLEMICPDVGILSPAGDPTSWEGVAGANAENEAVFDDESPAGEAKGQCLIKAKGKPDSTSVLTAATRTELWQMLDWKIDDAGKVKPDYEAVSGEPGHKNIRYKEMPMPYFAASGVAFGPKTLTLRFLDSYARPTWKYDQKMELFFERDGKSASEAAGNSPFVAPGNPNWYVYWTQIAFSFTNGISGTFGPQSTKMTYDSNSIGTSNTIRLGWHLVVNRTPWTDQINIYDTNKVDIVKCITTIHHENGHRQSDQLPNDQGGFGTNLVWSDANDQDADLIHDLWEGTNGAGYLLGFRVGVATSATNQVWRMNWDHGWISGDAVTNPPPPPAPYCNTNGIDQSTGSGICPRNEQHVQERQGDIEEKDWCSRSSRWKGFLPW